MGDDNYNVELRGQAWVFSNCITCGVGYVLVKTAFDHQRKYGGYHYCPNGHQQGWEKGGNTEFDILRRERDRLKQSIAHQEDMTAAAKRERDAAKGETKAYKGHLTRLKKRVAGGACPCCQRNFVNLQRHMKTKHPAYVSENAA